MDEIKYWLWLTMVFGVTSERIWELMGLFETASEAYYELVSDAEQFRLKSNEIKNIRSIDMSEVKNFIEQCRQKEIYICGYSSEEYPPQLRYIMCPPAVLYYKGNIKCLSGTRTVTSVGTRRASEYGLRTARKICRELAMNGFVIVSGFAVGIDITSQLAAAEVNRPTAAVMGCGLDIDYPRENAGFREVILANGGVFVSEYPPGTPPHSYNFPKRNRILSALGRAAIVFEGSEKSGSLITAKISAENGREVFVLPPADIFSSSFSGNIELLKDGAAPLYSIRDILDCFRIGSPNDIEIRSSAYTGISSFSVKSTSKVYVDSPAEEAIKHAVNRKKQEKKSVNAEKAAEKEQAETVSEKTDKAPDGIYETLTDIQKQIAGLLKDGSLHADVISQRLDIDSVELMVELTELEILGIIKSLPGKVFEIKVK